MAARAVSTHENQLGKSPKLYRGVGKNNYVRYWEDDYKWRSHSELRKLVAWRIQTLPPSAIV